MAFLAQHERAINNALNTKKAKSKERTGKKDPTPNIGESASTIEEASTKARDTGVEAGDGDADNDDEGDDDPTNARQRSRKAEALSYDQPDDDKEEISRRAQAAESEEKHEDKSDEGLCTDASVQDDSNKTIRSRKATVSQECISENIKRFEFDKDGGQWCEMKLQYPVKVPKVLIFPIVEKICQETVISLTQWHRVSSRGSGISYDKGRTIEKAGFLSISPGTVYYCF